MSSDESMDLSLSQLARSTRKAPARTKRSSLPPVAPEQSEVPKQKKRKAPVRAKVSETSQLPPGSQIPSTDAPPGSSISERKKRRTSEVSQSSQLPPASESPTSNAPQEFSAKPKSLEGKESQALPSLSLPSPPASVPPSPPTSEDPNTDASLEFEISKFDSSVENHFKAVDTISRLCGQLDVLDSENEENQRFSNSVIFLRQWRDFKYEPKVVKFACQQSLKESDVIGEITLPQFSSAAFPKRRMLIGSDITGTESNPIFREDFVIHVGGAVWALDWCPKDERMSDNHIKSEFVAVAAHPPESSYHKMGAPLTGRGAIQIWCLLTAREETSTNSVSLRPKGRPRKQGEPEKNKSGGPLKPRGRPRKHPVKNKPDGPPKPRGRPRKHPVENKPDGPQKPRGRPKKSDGNPVEDKPAETPRTSLRPRKKPVSYSVEEVDIDPLDVEPISVDFTYKNIGASLIRDRERTHEDIAGQQTDDERTDEDSDWQHERTDEDSDGNQTEDSDGTHEKAKKSRNLNPTERTRGNAKKSRNLIPCERTHENAKKSPNLIPKDVALPRMMLCLAHNGRVAWDVKWRPVHASHPGSSSRMGYLAVLLGSGALEVWEVPLPHTVKSIYPTLQASIDPRFIKLQPIFKCSMLKFGGRQSIPLTMEWSLSPPHDMILVGCHDGTVAQWKFSITDPSTETRPLLFFNADTGPIRSLAWTPPQSDLGSENIIVTAGFKGFKFWDIRDPFRPLWSHYIKGVSYCVDWLWNPRCVIGCNDDGMLWLISLLKVVSSEIPVAGKPPNTKKGIHHGFFCSSFSIWSAQASQVTGIVAYCGEDGNTFCFKPTARLVLDPRKENKVEHHLFGSMLEENNAMVVATPLPDGPLSRKTPSMKLRPKAADQEEMPEEHISNVDESGPVTKFGGDIDNEELPSSKSKSSAQKSKEEVKPKFDVFPPKSVAMHRVRWNVNKGSERWFCYGGAAGLVRFQEVDLESFY